MHFPASRTQMGFKYYTGKYFKNIFSILIVLLVIICLRAGFWQLDRADYKKEQEKLFLQSQQEGYDDFFNASHSTAITNYKKIRIEGVMGKKYWLIDNQVINKKVGFKQLQFIYLPERNENVFIILGWQEKFYNKKNTFRPFNGQVNIEGVAKNIDANPYLNTDKVDTSLTILPGIDQELLSKISDKSANTSIIYAHSINGKEITTNQIVPTFNPEKHLGYAFQWFSFALMLFGYSIFLFYQSFKKN